TEGPDTGVGHHVRGVARTHQSRRVLGELLRVEPIHLFVVHHACGGDHAPKTEQTPPLGDTSGEKVVSTWTSLPACRGSTAVGGEGGRFSSGKPFARKTFGRGLVTPYLPPRSSAAGTFP